MWSFILELDWNLFQIINEEWSNAFFDSFLPWMRNGWLWFPFYVFMISYFFFKWQKKGWLILFFFLLTASLCDFVSASVIKPSVERLRPCNDEDRVQDVQLRVRCGRGYSFPSSHATNHFGIAFFLFLLFNRNKGRLKYLLLFWAVLISYSQIYVGVHYPLDILGGCLLGTIIAFLMFTLLKFYLKYFFPKKEAVSAE